MKTKTNTNQGKMTKSILRVVAVMAAVAFTPQTIKAGPGWPSDFEGVMMQSFYWDSFSEIKWKTLETQSDELAEYFKLLWVPNSGRCSSNPSNGYDPVYWFTNHNTSYGTEAEIRSMIKTFKEKGVGIIADVVINHRNGVSNWTNFPAEVWNGQTWKIGPEGICSTDEVRNQSGQAKPTGAPDTGDDFNGARDLDHTNANVQNNCKNYCKFLLTDMGYSGFRLDMVKGYAGRYTKIYNQYSNPTYCVGEYWDGSYDALAAWIEATGKTSAAFDFAFKYAVNDAFANGDMTKLVWMANGSNPQPAGLIHFGYPQYAVTFIDNHDTSRDDWNKFNGNLLAAHAFMICSPGTPCVFYPHWRDNKAAIGAMIKARNLAGVTNTSAVKVLKTTRDCYMAEVYGTKGTLVVKVGPTMDGPSNYSNSEIQTTGTDYCIWVKTNGTVNPNPDTDNGKTIRIYYDNSETKWSTINCYSYANDADNNGAWPGKSMDNEGGNIHSITIPSGSNVVFNNGSAQTVNVMSVQDKHLYRGLSSTESGEYGKQVNKVTDNGVYNSGNGDEQEPTPVPDGDVIYLLGEPAGGWAANKGTAISGINGKYTHTGVLEDTDNDGWVYFGFAEKLGSNKDDWNTLNSHRYGSAVNSQLSSPDSNGNTVADYYTLNGSGTYRMGYPNSTSWRLAPGEYTFTIDTNTKTLTVDKGTTSVEAVESADEDTMYFNLQGQRVANPEHGIYIRVTKNKAEKVMIQ